MCHRDHGSSEVIQSLIKEGVITPEEFDNMKTKFKNLLEEQFKTAKEYKPKLEWYEGVWSRFKPEKGKDKREKYDIVPHMTKIWQQQMEDLQHKKDNKFSQSKTGGLFDTLYSNIF